MSTRCAKLGLAGTFLGGAGCHFYAELDGNGINPGRLERAVRAVIARHAMLRARFLDDGRLCMSNNAAERELRAVAMTESFYTSSSSVWKH